MRNRLLFGDSASGTSDDVLPPDALEIDLVVTDCADPDQLVEAANIMTEEQTIAMSGCLGGG